MNRALDAIASPSPTFCGVAAPAYLVIGVAGVATAYTVLVARLMHEAMPLALALLVGTASLASFVLAGMLRKRLGRAPHILLEDVALALLVVAGLAFVFEIDVVRLLDRVIVAFGVFLVFGRLGCLASGCCHGRPATVGVRYPQSSIGDALAGIRLFPVQMIEAVWIALVTWWASEQHAPGTALELWRAATRSSAVGGLLGQLVECAPDRQPRSRTGRRGGMGAGPGARRWIDDTRSDRSSA